MTKVPSAYKLKKPFWIFTGGAASLVLLYIFLVGLTFSNTLARQRSEEGLTRLRATVSELEFAYLKEKSEINATYARELGFVDSKDTIVIKAGQEISRSR